MFFNTKPPVNPVPSAPPPPWVNIDESSKKKVSTTRFRFNLMEFTQQVTGFSRWGTRIFLLGFAVSLCLVAYAIYYSDHTPQALPPNRERPAMDAKASSTPLQLTPTPIPISTVNHE